MMQGAAKVRLGLHLVYFSVCLILALVPVTLGLGFSHVDVKTAELILTSMIVGASIFGFVGPILCMAVPAETRAIPFITSSVVLSLIVLGLRLGSDWIFQQLAREVDMQTFFTIAKYYTLALGTMQLLGLVFFLLFCHQLGKFLWDDASAKRASGLMQTGVAIILLIIGLVVYLIKAPIAAQQGDLAFIVSMILLGLLFAAMFWLISYGKLLLNLRRSIAEYRGNTSYDDAEATTD